MWQFYPKNWMIELRIPQKKTWQRNRIIRRHIATVETPENVAYYLLIVAWFKPCPRAYILPLYMTLISIIILVHSADNCLGTAKKKVTTFSRLLRGLKSHRKEKHGSCSPKHNHSPRQAMPPQRVSRLLV